MRLPQADWSRWVLASGIAVAVILFVLMLFRWPKTESGGTPAARPAAVTLAPDSDPLLTEEAMMRDPTPLFLPTRWNTAGNAFASDARPEPGDSFQGYPPAWKFVGAELRLDLPPAVKIPAAPAEAFASEKGVPAFTGLGRTDRGVTPLAPRGAFVEISAAADGQAVFARLLDDVRPPGEAVWHPLEFLVAVDSTGMVPPPVLIESSQVAAVDGFFKEYLAKGFHIGERLAPGLYRVSIGP